MMTNMKRNHRLSILFMSGLLLLGGSVLTGCDSDELDTNPYNKSGVNLVAFGPCPLTRLDNMRITGTQLNKVDKVLFPQGNSKIDEATSFEEASFRLVNDKEIEVTVPDQTIPGKLRLVVGNDTIVSKANITFEEEVEISAVTPVKNLRAGDVITISGEFVWNIATVTFCDHVVVEAEDFLVNTRKEIKLTVPREARSGEVTFGTGDENATETAWTEPLEIRQAVATGLSNITPEFGEQITIQGTDLDLVGAVNFPMLTDSIPFTVSDDGRQLTTKVPATTISGKISLVQYSGLTVETPAYTLPMAEYTAIAPNEELKKGDVVTITGKNLDRVQKMELPGGIILKQGEFTQSTTQIQLTVPEEMGDGKVKMIQHENYSIETDKVTMHHEGAEIPIWQGNVVVGEWSGSMDALSWGKYDWSNVKPGQILTAYLKMNAGAGDAKVRFGNGGWTALPTSGGDLDLLATDERLSITLTQADIDELVNNGGLVICGANFTITKVTLSVLETIVWSGSWECASWAGNQELAWGGYDWSILSVGQKIIFTVGFADPSLGWACISPRMGKDWGNLSVSQIDLTPGAEDQKVEFIPTAADIAHLQNDGGLVITGTDFVLKQVSIQ